MIAEQSQPPDPQSRGAVMSELYVISKASPGRRAEVGQAIERAVLRRTGPGVWALSEEVA